LTKIILEKFENKITQMQKVKKEIIPLLASVKSDLLKDVFIGKRNCRNFKRGKR
jgi:hypothetical protein